MLARKYRGLLDPLETKLMAYFDKTQLFALTKNLFAQRSASLAIRMDV